MTRPMNGSGNGAAAGDRVQRSGEGVDDRSPRFDPEVFASPDVEEGIGRWLPVEDLTAADVARAGERDGGIAGRKGATGQPADAGRSPDQHTTHPSLALLLRFARVLCRSSAFHLLLVGDRGVGKTELLRELAFRAVTGDVPFLDDRRFVRIDCSQVPREESRAVLQAVMRFGRGAGDVREANDRGRDLARGASPAANGPRLVLCLDGLAGLLRGPNGGNHVADFVTALHQSRVPVIGVLSRWEYNELLAGQAEIRELSTKVELDEPSDETTLSIVARHVPGLETEFDTVIPESVQKRTVSLTSSFLLNERQPAKSLRVLRLACEEAAFERRMKARFAASGGGQSPSLDPRPSTLVPQP